MVCELAPHRFDPHKAPTMAILWGQKPRKQQKRAPERPDSAATLPPVASSRTRNRKVFSFYCFCPDLAPPWRCTRGVSGGV